jgi:beta-glucosidase
MRIPRLVAGLFLAALLGFAVYLIIWQRSMPPARQELFTNFDPQAKVLLAQMTLDEKIGQMCQPDQSYLKDPADIGKYFLGSLLSGGGSGPKDKSQYTMQGWANMVDGYQAEALKTRLAIPLLYGVDDVHGHNNIPGAVVFPHNIGLGCTRDPALVERVERVTAEEVRATGINWGFAPCVTVPQDERWGRTYEGYSENPNVVRALAGAAVRGFQGDDLSNPGSILACAKHFIGDGGTAFGTSKVGLLDQGDTECDEATLKRIHLPGYIAALGEGVGSVMISYSSWNGVKCTASRHLVTDLLKKHLGFKGFVISDYNAVDQITPDYKKAIKAAINAGVDMVMLTNRYPTFCRDLKELVDDGEVRQARIDDAVTRILRVKFALGLMDKNRSPMTDRHFQDLFGSPEHREVARQAVRESVVLLKNDKSVLPLSKTMGRIHVAGAGADSLGMQCGGWTIGWQGSMNNVIPGGTSLLTAIRRAVSGNTQVTYSADGSGAEGADVGVLVVGEKPYAEHNGDKADLSLSAEDTAAFARMKATGIPVVVIVFSGRPLILGAVAEQTDALVAAWLPGSEGEGLADVLFGDYNPTGKLSRTWPRTMASDPAHPPESAPNPLFPFGYGLGY